MYLTCLFSCCSFFLSRVCLDIAVLVLVFNAAKSCPTMPALFSDHTFCHYAYLRDSLSHLVPHLRVRNLLSVHWIRLNDCLPYVSPLKEFDPHLTSRLFSQLPGRKQTAGSEASGVASGSLESARTFLQDSIVRVSALQNLESPGAQDLLEFTIRYKTNGFDSRLKISESLWFKCLWFHKKHNTEFAIKT